MSSPNDPSPTSPESPITPPLMMLPRTKAPRRQVAAPSQTPSRPSTSTAPITRTSPPKPRRASASNGHGRPTHSGPSSSAASSSSISANESTKSIPLTTPSTSTQPTSQPPSTGAPLKRKSADSSSTNLSSMIPAATPQTGASKMAAAAKRGNAGLVEMVKKEEDEDHPLSEKCLRQRDYQTIHTLNRLFHLPSRWRLIRPLGQGAYGLVIQVQDSLSGEPVAVKCITRVFDKVILARRALREITLLRHFGEHPNLTGLIDLDNVWEGYNEIYLYMEPMEADLHQIIRSGQELTNGHIEFFTYQLLRGMKYIHSANVIHRDLKPGNLLVNGDCELKICDFGLARGFLPVDGEAAQGEELKLTEYVATRWYRAPEIMLSNKRYTTAIDVWSIGCILGELLGGKAMFQGKDYVSQLNLILEIVGTPDDETIDRTASEKAAAYMRTLPHHPAVDLKEMFPRAEPEAVALLSPLLAFDPCKRISVAEAILSPYMRNYHNAVDEPTCHATFDKWKLVESLETIEELKAAITQEIEEYRQEVRQVYQADAETGDEIFDDSMSLGASIPESIPEEDSALAMSPTSPQSVGVPFAIPDTGESRTSPRKRIYADVGMSPAAVTSSLPETTQDPRPPRSGRSASRRSSGNSVHSRRAASFLFSSPLGGGMTPLPSLNAAATGGPGAPGVPPPSGIVEATSRDSISSSTGTSTPAHWARPSRSRAPSGAGGEFASLRPLIRQLSAIGVDRDTRPGRGGSLEGDLGRDDDCPMSVSPHDAPPSEHPKSFGQPSRPPSAPPAADAQEAEGGPEEGITK